MNEKRKSWIFYSCFILMMFITFAASALDNYGKITLSKTATKKDDRKVDISLKMSAKNLEKTTLDLVLVIDRSGSMNDYISGERKMVIAKRAATSFVNALLPEGNSDDIRMGIVTYGTTIFDSYTSKSLTNNKQTILNTIDSISNSVSNAGTNIQIGLKTASELLNGSTATNKIVVLISDGKPTYFTHDNGKVCGSGGNDNHATGSDCPYKRPSEAAKAEADALKGNPYSAEIYAIGFGSDASQIASFLSTSVATSKEHCYSATNTADLNSNFSDIARKIKGTIAKDVTIQDIVPVGFNLSDSSRQALINKYGSSNVTFTTNAENETIITINMAEINANFGSQSIDYEVIADEDHYGSMYTNKEATLTATATEFNHYYDATNKKIELTFNKPVVSMEMVTKDDDYTATPVKEGESLTISKENGILKNDSRIKHEDVPTDGLGVSVSDEIFISKNPTCGNIILNNDGSFTYNASGKCRGDVTFEYYVESTVSFTEEDKEDEIVNSNKSIVTLKVVRNETSYTVRYLENETLKQLSSPKNANGYAYDTVTESPININGYKPVDTNSKTITLDIDSTKNIIVFYYEREVAELEDPTIEKTGSEKITATDQVIDYQIDYQTEIDKYIGTATITIVDTLPYEIDLSKSNISEGTYSSTNKTITWTLTYDVNTYNNVNNIINVTKNISVVYIYPEFKGTEERLMNQVTGTTHVETTTDKSATDTEYNEINIEGTLVEKHIYINEDSTQESLIPDVTTTKKVGTAYTTTKKNIAGYQIKTEPTNKNGKYIEGNIEVVYIYEKVPAEIKDSAITKTSLTGTITDKNTSVSYRLFYTATIKDYRGTAKITVVDTLPYHINVSKSDLKDGSYNNENKTITWTFDIEDINTFSNGDKVITIPIEYSVTYTDIDAYASSMINLANATLKVDTAPADVVRASSENKIYIEGNVTIKYVDTDNLQLLSDKEISGKVGTDYTTSPETIPGYELKTTPSNATGKYTERPITVTYVYSRLAATTEDSILTKTGTTEITASNAEFTYNLSYSTLIKGYKGNLTLTLIDNLPYEIDESKSNINGGTYSSTNKTITWTLEYADIDPSKEFSIDFNKQIKVVYKNLNPTLNSAINKLNVSLVDDFGNKTDSKETEHETKINIKGNVITKFVDEDLNEIATRNETEGKVGTDYVADSKSIIGYENPVLIQGSANGKYIEGTITVVYKYSKKRAKITDEEMTKDSSIAKVEATNTLVDYQISYTGKLDDYKGTATFKIVDYLPYEIDLSKSDLAHGTYNSTNKTITWEIVQNDIDTYADGIYEISIQKDIVLKYINMSSKNDIVNKVVGETITQTGSSNPKVEDEKVIKASIKGNLIVEYVYIDSNGVETILNSQNSTDYVGEEYTTSPKSFNGYQLENDPTNKNGNYIEGTIKVRYLYKRVPAIVEKNNLKKTSDNSVVENVEDSFDYTINYETEIKDYIGSAIVTIVDNLSYEIDEANSILQGGTYNKEQKTITWEYTYDVNSYERKNNNISIENKIKLTYLNLDPSKREVINEVVSKLELETKEPTEEDDETSTRLEVKGNVLVKFLDEKDNVLEIEETITGLVGEDYETNPKEILGYELVNTIGNENGQFIDGEIVVTYVYKKEPENIVIPPKTGIKNNKSLLILGLASLIAILKKIF